MYDFSEYLERALNKALGANRPLFIVSWFLSSLISWFAKRNVWRWVSSAGADDAYFLLDAIESILLLIVIVLLANRLKMVKIKCGMGERLYIHLIELATVSYLGIYTVELLDSSFFDRCTVGIMEYIVLGLFGSLAVFKLIYIANRWKNMTI